MHLVRADRLAETSTFRRPSNYSQLGGIPLGASPSANIAPVDRLQCLKSGKRSATVASM